MEVKGFSGIHLKVYCGVLLPEPERPNLIEIDFIKYIAGWSSW
jgi:hypothetical protein